MHTQTKTHTQAHTHTNTHTHAHTHSPACSVGYNGPQLQLGPKEAQLVVYPSDISDGDTHSVRDPIAPPPPPPSLMQSAWGCPSVRLQVPQDKEGWVAAEEQWRVHLTHSSSNYSS